MRSICVFVFLGLVAFTLARPEDTYTDRWDNINIDEILESDRLLNKYTDCLLDKGRCSPDAKTLKETLPDALEHDCSKCTKKQKDGSTKVIKHFVNKRPDLWEQLSKKYDPKGIYAQKYKEVIKSA